MTPLGWLGRKTSTQTNLVKHLKGGCPSRLKLKSTLFFRTWFQRPLKDIDQLKCRHDAISYFVNPRNMEVVKTLEDSVKHVKNISVRVTVLLTLCIWGYVLTLLLLNTTCPVLANSVDPDQLASEEANWSGLALFVIKYVNFHQKRGSSNPIGWKLEVGLAS